MASAKKLQKKSAISRRTHHSSEIEIPVGGFEYPRPQLRRPRWINLNGSWRFGFKKEIAASNPREISKWPRKIEVPFCPESKRSGIGDTAFHLGCWYERDFEIEPQRGSQVFIRFGAADYSASVWVNGQFVGSHEGGHTPFSFNIGAALKPGSRQRVTVYVEDDPQDLAKPRGKQDWELNPHSIWYPRTTGIWQTVWIEEVPSTYLERVRWTPHLERWQIDVEALIGGIPRDDVHLRITLHVGEQILACDTYKVIGNELYRGITLSDPGIDDYRNRLLWSPEKPTLIQAKLELLDSRGSVIDTVYSYTALRCVSTQRDRFMLNGRPYYLRLVLDQGYWPETLMTPPSTEDIQHDILLTKAMGFNGVRKHQKVEDPRFLFWADTLGLLVWEEMPSAYRFTHDAVERISREWMEVLDRDLSHPCIVVWVPFNESWGVPDLPEKEAHQNCVQALYHLTKTLDPTRPCIGNDGWEATTTDIIGIHDYDGQPQRIYMRYGPQANLQELFGRRRPGGRLLTLDEHPHRGQPIMLTEFGGIAITPKDPKANDWGYSFSSNNNELEARYTRLLAVVNSVDHFAGFCYTQLTDTFQEANGLLTADRKPKFPLERISSATRGLVPINDEPQISSVKHTEETHAHDLPALPQSPQIPVESQ